jgi:DNA-binding CsgD family transcriptional regulator
LDHETLAHLLELLGPHLTNIVRLSQELARLRSEAALRDAAFDRLAAGIALVGQNGRLLYANKAIDTLLAAGTALTIAGGQLQATDRRAAAQLQRALSACTTGAWVDGTELAISLPRAGQRRSLHLLVVPLHTALPSLDRPAGSVALLVIADPAAPPSLSAATLASVFGLSHSQAVVLDLLATGISPAEAAATLGIALSTVRSHIAAVLQTLNCSRLTEAIALANRHPRLLVDD